MCVRVHVCVWLCVYDTLNGLSLLPFNRWGHYKHEWELEGRVYRKTKHAYIYIYMYVYINVYMHLYIYIYICMNDEWLN